MRQGKPHHRTELLGDTDYSIVARYQSEFRWVVQYYLLAPACVLAMETALGDVDIAPQDPCP